MKSIMKKKGLLNLSLCLITVLVVSSCASGNYREVAEESKNDVAKIEDGNQAPHKFHSKRFESYNERY